MEQILTIVGTIALPILIWEYAVRRLAVDILRQKLFGVRNKLFLHATTGETQFDSMQYKMLNLKINSLIRYAHRLSVVNILLKYFFDTKLLKRDDDQFIIEDYQSYLSTSETDKERRIYVMLEEQIGFIILLLAFFANPITMILTLIGLFLSHVVIAIKRINSKEHSNKSTQNWYAEKVTYVAMTESNLKFS